MFSKIKKMFAKKEPITLFEKISVMTTVDGYKKSIILSDPVRSYQKPPWEIALSKSECKVLSEVLLRESR